MAAQTLKGFRDFLPEQMAVRERVIATLRSVFERYGFLPLMTPTLEYADVLMGKYGEEADKLLYLFNDRGGRKIGLNYDLTVPLARVLSQYPNLPLPFKRYQIQPAYRAENPQKGRYRQFTQCDIDTVGSSSPSSDAEIITVIYAALKALGFYDFEINLNSRVVSYSMMEKCAIPQDKWNTVLQTVDKLDKKSLEELDQELLEKGFEHGLFSNKIQWVINDVATNWRENKTSGDPYLDTTYKLAIEMGVEQKNLKFNPSIVRGLDYYTGPVFETFVKDAGIGSVMSGGRYDHLIEKLGGPSLPGVGVSLGLDRICDVIEQKNLWNDTPITLVKALVTVFSPNLLLPSLESVKALREAGINAEIWLDSEAKLDKQLKYADAKGIPYALIIGPDEAAEKMYMLKDLKARTQEKFSLAQILEKLR